MRRMRVLMLVKDDVPGGISRHVEQLSRALRARNLTVEIAAPRARGVNAFAREANSHLLQTRSLGRFCSTELSPGLAWLAAARQADVVHVHVPNPVAIGGLSLVPRARLAVTYHCDLDHTFGPAGVVYDALLHRVLRSANCVFIASEAMRRSSNISSLGSQVRVVPFGIEPARFLGTPSPRSRRLTEQFGPRTILFVGRLVYYKGLDVLLRSMRSVCAPLVIVGEGPERPRLERLAKTLGISGQVHFEGYVAEELLADYYHSARALVLPSVSIAEAFGLVQLEAAFSGIPVVSSRLATGVSEVNIHGQTGLTVTAGNEAELAAALRLLLENESLARQLGGAAKARALQQFTAERMADRIHAGYDELLLSNPP